MAIMKKTPFYRIILFSLFTTILSLDVAFTQSANDYYMDAAAKLLNEDYEGAIEAYDKVIELIPDNALSYNNRGSAKVELGDYKGAIKDGAEVAKG